MVHKVINDSFNLYGADKIFRLAQYTLSYISESQKNKQLAQISASISQTRMNLRLLGIVHTIITIRSSKTRTEKLKNIILLPYYFAEHVYWLGSFDLVAVDSLWWSRISCQAWFFYLMINLYDNIKAKDLFASLSDIGDTVLAFHYSVEKSALDEKFVAFCGVISSILKFDF